MQRILTRTWITLCVIWFFIAIPIALVYHHGASGLSWVFTHYLAAFAGIWVPVFWRVWRLWPLLVVFALILAFVTIPSLFRSALQSRK